MLLVRIAMDCENLESCLEQDMLQDPSIMAWMRMNPPPSLPLHSSARAEATQQLAVQESHLLILNARLDDARRQVEPTPQIAEHILIQIKRTRLGIAKSRASLAPIRCLPNEILRYIIASVDPPELPDQLGKIVMLCCVCKRWNQVARATPELWTNWRLHFCHRTELDDNTLWSNLSTPERLGEFLLKSTPRLLDIYITSTCNSPHAPYAETPDNVLRNLSTVLQSINRCSRLVYQCFQREERCFCPRITDELNRGSSLGELSWMCGSSEHWAHFDQLPGSIQLEGLRSLIVARNDKIIQWLHVPNLSKLVLVQMSLDSEDLPNLAASLPNLLVLRCHDVTFHREDPVALTPIKFHMLRDLHVTCHPNWPSDPNVAHTLMHDSTTLVNVRRNITQWRNLGGIPDLKPGINISFLEFELDVNAKKSPSWIEPNVTTRYFSWSVLPRRGEDWFSMMPNLITMVLKWVSTPHDVEDNDDNNFLAANILHELSISNDNAHCRRLKRLTCHGAIRGEASAAASGTRVLLMHLENFIFCRSAERAESNGVEECLVSLSWRHTPTSAHLPDLVDAGWEEVRGLLDLLPDEEAFSDDDVTEVSECTWSGKDLDVDCSDWSHEEEEEEEEMWVGWHD